MPHTQTQIDDHENVDGVATIPFIEWGYQHQYVLRLSITCASLMDFEQWNAVLGL